MVARSKQMPCQIRCFLPLQRPAVSAKNIFHANCSRAASTFKPDLAPDSASQPVAQEADAQKPPPSTPSFQFTAPIRKIVEPRIIDRLRLSNAEDNDRVFRALRISRQPPRERVLKLPVRHILPGFPSKRGARKPNPFRDIYYDPPPGWKPPALIKNERLELSRFQTRMKHVRPSFRPVAASSTPFQPQAFRRCPPSGILRVRYRQQRATFSTSPTPTQPPDAAPAPSQSQPEPLSIDRYHHLADLYIDNLVAKLEEIQEERPEVDCEYS
ncbi:MAG: hypothetical protein Q9207_008414, partial [Kuettlingeria erythrocarpa]